MTASPRAVRRRGTPTPPPRAGHSAPAPTPPSHPEATFDPVKIYGREAYQVVEIGSGLGGAIVHRAAGVPGGELLAVEVYPRHCGLLLKMGNAGIGERACGSGERHELLDNMLEENSVDELWVFFPDPGTKVPPPQAPPGVPGVR